MSVYSGADFVSGILLAREKCFMHYTDAAAIPFRADNEQEHYDVKPRLDLRLTFSGDPCIVRQREYISALQCRGIRARNTLAWATFSIYEYTLVH